MTIAQVKEFERELEKIIKWMMEKDLLPKNVDVAKLVQNITKKLDEDKDVHIYADDLKKEGTVEALKLACKAELVQENNPQFKFNYALLFKDQNDMTKEQKEQFKLELKNELKNLFKEMSKFFHEPSPELDKKLDDLAQLLTHKFTEKDIVAEDKNSVNLIFGVLTQLDQLAEQRRELYGVDTHTPGALQFTIQAVPEGNRAGLLDMANSGESFMGDLHSANPDKPDPLGVSMANIIRDIGSGALSMVTIERLEQDNILTPTPSPSFIQNPFDISKGPKHE